MVDSSQECIFCSIISGKIPSYKIGENSDALAVLEINPISRGHALIIPKKHSALGEKIPKEIANLIAPVSGKISEKLKPKEVMVAKATLFGHDIINLVPMYKDEDINSERHPAEKEELEEMQKILLEKKQEVKKPEKPKKIAKKKKTRIITSKNTWLPRRIP